ncbi:antibiotic biosynthesis monooxygenase [Micrococcus sp.]|uniref:antibiotic biosynthesis monooxygenase family protein n=1 Tax=Micrococcus sp. TaxID=1271 RepID=UPI0026DCDDEB|nr:antibiotic biosynthesis monooxygenase [Micrococcus sp.]MDO4240412.1 antibiotic biosynthesis monooxygenase [Micrococcus sp.]
MSVVKINAITVPEGAGPELEKRFAARKHAVDQEPGFEGFQLLRPTAGADRYFVVTTWASEEHFAAWRDGRMPAAHAAEKDGRAGVRGGAPGGLSPPGPEGGPGPPGGGGPDAVAGQDAETMTLRAFSSAARPKVS